MITICARGGSKGIPGKNIKLLNGIPLIAYTINIAKKFASGKRAKIAISTDSIEILNVASKFGVNTNYIRPSELATDHVGKIDVINDLLKYEEKNLNCKYKNILDLDITSPIRCLSDLQKAFDLFSKNHNSLNLFSVNPSNRNPYFNMVEKKQNGYYNLIINNGNYFTRQGSPKTYDLNASFYFYKRIFFENNFKTVFTDRSMIFEMNHVCFDLDHNIDFTFLEFLLSIKYFDFELW